MLTFRQLDDLPDRVVEIWAQAQQDIIDDMARRMARLGGVTGSTTYQMERLAETGMVMNEAQAKLAGAMNMTEETLTGLFDEAATRTLTSDDNIYTAAGLSPTPLAASPAMQQIIWAGLEKTMGEFYNLTGTMASNVGGLFWEVLDRAYLRIATGAFDYQSAIKMAIKELAGTGLHFIKYPSGHLDYIDVATRRAVLTGISQTAAKLQEYRFNEMGCQFVETTAHAGARSDGSRGPSDHAWWQGRVFFWARPGETNPSEYPDFIISTGYGTGPGLCGWNCRHSFYPFYPGLSETANTSEQLAAMNSATVTYNGKSMNLYEATQQQRYIERQIRRWKREASAMEAAGLDSSAAKEKIREWQGRQRDFTNQTGLRRDYFRERGGAQNNATYSNADIAQTLSGNSFRKGNADLPKKTAAPDMPLQNGYRSANINLPAGTMLTDVRVIAGQTTSVPLRDTPRLNAEYGGDPTQWQKKVGTATVNGEKVYLHWYENNGQMREVAKKP